MSLLAKAWFMTEMLRLILDREDAGGELSQEQEADRVAELDKYWWQMSSAEQEEVEAFFSAPAPGAPDSLGEVDLKVVMGKNWPPRRRDQP